MIDFTLVHAHLKKLKAKQDNSSLQESVEQRNTFDYQNSTNSMAYSSNTGLVPLTNVMEEVWHGPITLGGQEMPINFDTGSSDVSLGYERRITHTTGIDIVSHISVSLFSSSSTRVHISQARMLSIPARILQSNMEMVQQQKER